MFGVDLDRMIFLRACSPEAAPLAAGSSWQWQLSGTIDTSYDVSVYDVDLFDAPEGTDQPTARPISMVTGEPIEVKAGAAGSMKSLHAFMHGKQLPLAVRFDTNAPSVQDVAVRTTTGDVVKYKLLSLPLYMVESLPVAVQRVIGETTSRVNALQSPRKQAL